MARVVCRRGGAHLRLNRSGCPIPSRTTPCSFGTFDAVVAAPGLVVGPEPVAVVPKCARPVAGCRRAAVLAAAAPPHCGRLYAHLRGVGRLVSWGQCHAHGLPVRRQHKVCTGRGGEGRRSRRSRLGGAAAAAAVAGEWTPPTRRLRRRGGGGDRIDQQQRQPCSRQAPAAAHYSVLDPIPAGAVGQITRCGRRRRAPIHHARRPRARAPHRIAI
jgi:hypothetical protein